MFVTLIYILLDIKTGDICFSNAGHLSPLFVDEQGVQIIGSHKAKGPPLGILPNAEYGQDRFSLKKEGMILIYTDGIIEAKHLDQKLYGASRLERVVEACPKDCRFRGQIFQGSGLK